MVATERIKRAETEDELKEVHLEKEALRSALRLLEGQHSGPENSSPAMPFTTSPSPTAPPSTAPAATTLPIVPMSAPLSHSRTSSVIAIKSAPISPSTSRALTASPSPVPSPSPSPSPLPLSRPQSPRTLDDNTTQRQRPPPLPLDQAGGTSDQLDVDAELEDEPTPQIRRSRPPSLLLHESLPAYDISPWADAQSQSHPLPRSTLGFGVFTGAAAG